VKREYENYKRKVREKHPHAVCKKIYLGKFLQYAVARTSLDKDNFLSICNLEDFSWEVAFWAVLRENRTKT
jgi:hypothetical protein